MAKRIAKKSVRPGRPAAKKVTRKTATAAQSLDSTAIPFTFHPRVFESLGSDLVTSDLVAITELAKNAYDANATRVDIRFLDDPERGPYIEIADDGVGMSLKTIQEVWTVVATPNRKFNPVSVQDGSRRRVSGEKGLGRLSVARLGDELVMFTKMRREPSVKATVRWSAFNEADSLSNCVVRVTQGSDDPLIKSHGTVLRIYDLRSEWNADQSAELQDYLARLISPFQEKDTFQVWLHQPGADTQSVQIHASHFLEKPKYRISGELSDSGKLTMKYEYTPIGERRPARTQQTTMNWAELQGRIDNPHIAGGIKPLCGPFGFELRAWDIAPNDVQEIHSRYEVQKSLVRKAIQAHKGVSVYRDGILVLPKSETARDWLGLDIRRVSELGSRLSTSQIVGYVSISAEGNPSLRDTSDRERLVDGSAVRVFQDIIKYVILTSLENERTLDRAPRTQAEKPLKKLFDGLNTESLLSQLHTLVKQNRPAKDAESIVDRFAKELNHRPRM